MRAASASPSAVVAVDRRPDLAGQRRLHRAGRPGRRGHHLRPLTTRPAPVSTGAGRRRSRRTRSSTWPRCRPPRSATAATCATSRPNEALMLTDDENIIDIQFSVQYKLKDPVAWVFNNRDQRDTVRDAAESAMRDLVGDSKMDYVLYEGREQHRRRRRRAHPADRRPLRAGRRDHQRDRAVGAAARTQSRAAFDDTVKAQRGPPRERKSEAQAFANDIIPQARGKAAAPDPGRRSLPRRRGRHTPPATPPASTRWWPNTPRRRPSRATACTSTPCSRSSPAPARS